MTENLQRAILDSRAHHPSPRLPDGWRAVDVYTNGSAIVVCGRPDSEDEDHNCDAMGCGSIGSHVLYYISIHVEEYGVFKGRTGRRDFNAVLDSPTDKDPTHE